MRKTLLTAFAAAALLLGPMLASPAGAITLAAPSAMGVAAADNTGLVQKTAVVCGYRGCVRVYPHRYYNYYGYGYYGRPYWYGRPYGWHRWYW